MAIINKQKPRWEKVLYKKQAYPENYVDSSFLENLKKNLNIRKQTYSSLVTKSYFCISLQMNVVSLFVNIFLRLYIFELSGFVLIVIDGLLFILGVVFWGLTFDASSFGEEKISKFVKKVFKSSFIISCILFSLTPVLKTLTLEVSSDSIWAFTTISLLANLVFYDYSVKNNKMKKQPLSFCLNPVATNAAIFAAILLASRLNTFEQVFGLIIFAMIFFAVFPMFEKHIRTVSSKYSFVLTTSSLIVSVYLYFKINYYLALTYCFFVAFIVIVCPYWFVFSYRYKNEITGPWDEAKPKLKTKIL